MKDIKRSLSILTELDNSINNYIPGDLLAIVDIRDKLLELKKELEKYEPLKKLNTILEYITKVVELISKDKDKETKGLPLLTNIIKLFSAFFNKKLHPKELANNLNANIPLIKELLNESKTKKRDKRKKDLSR